MIIRKFFFLALVFCFVSTSSAQEIWEKPSETWSKVDAFKVLTTSPWAQTFRSTNLYTNGYVSNSQPIVGRTAGNEIFAATQSRFPLVIRLNSALPVRQAMLRLQKIEAGYDKMSKTERNQFDAKSKTFLDCSVCEDYYVISIYQYYDKSPSTFDENFFQTKSFDDLRGKIRLVSNDKSERELAQFTAPSEKGEPAVFFFKRKDSEGNLLISSKTKSFKFVFDSSLTKSDILSRGSLPNNFSFKKSELILNNKLEF